MELSVIVTNYNKSKWLPSLLEELKKQKRDEVEYIIIDDCSTDNSRDIIDGLDKNIFRVVYHSKNIGIGLTRQEGLEISKGKYITFIDSDDYISFAYIKILLSYLNKGYDIIQFPYEYNNTGEIVKEKEDWYVWCKAYSKSFLSKNNIRFQDLRSSEDYEFNYEVEKYNPKYFIIQGPVLYYYKSNSLTRPYN